MKIGAEAYGNEDDVESLEIDVDKILSDGNPTARANRKHSSAQQKIYSRWNNYSRRRSSSMEFEGSKIAPNRPPNDLIIQSHGQDDEEISNIMTADMFYDEVGEGKATRPAAEKHLHNDGDGHSTDGTAESNEEVPRDSSRDINHKRMSEERLPKYSKCALVIAVLLLLLICFLGFIFDKLVESGRDSSLNDRSMEAGWELRPTLPPVTWQGTTGNPTPRPTSQARDTRPPTKVPTEQPSTSPSKVPTVTESGHLLELLSSTATADKTIEAVGVRGSPQQKAHEWLHKDPSYFDYTTTSKLQRFALAVLYFSTVRSASAYAALETWMDYDTHECSWFTSWYENRLPCGTDGIFKFLSLRNIGLTGTVPSELALLSNLRALVMNDNILSGSLPEEFGEWSSLETLDLHGNFLSGRLPDNVPILRKIDLSLNLLAGPLPPMDLTQITSMDLTQNPNLFGVIPFDLCSLSDQILDLAVDCNQVYCSCCTRCDSDRTRAPAFMGPTATPSVPPTQLPSTKPTSVPTKTPTKAPTPVPTKTPTKSPTSMPTLTPTRAVPTPQPTPDPFCIDTIQTSKQCYMVGEPIDVIYANCNPTTTDWIGIYDMTYPEDALFDPLLSQRTCINEPCSGVQQISNIVLDESSRGSFNWPLASGKYKVYMFRGGSAVGPHAFFSQSLAITVDSQSCW